jgi:hypothetical protein
MYKERILEILAIVSDFLLNHIVFVVLIVIAWFVVRFSNFINSLVMKHDIAWITWYRSKYRCPRCSKYLKPADQPPDYYCKKCAQIYTFGDIDIKEWVKNKPLITRGALVRYSILILILTISLLYLYFHYWSMIAGI